METGVTQDLISCIQKEFELTPVDIRTYSPLTLAYIGDGVYELIIRTVLVEQGNLQPAKLHKKSSGLVKAAAQAAMILRSGGAAYRGRTVRLQTRQKCQGPIIPRKTPVWRITGRPQALRP